MKRMPGERSNAEALLDLVDEQNKRDILAILRAPHYSLISLIKHRADYLATPTGRREQNYGDW